MRRVLKFGLIGVGLVLAAAFWWSATRTPDPGPPIALRLAIPPRPATAAGFIAAGSGLFGRHGLAVTLERAASGRAAVDEVIAGRAEVGLTAETPVVFAALRGQPIVVLASVYQSNDHHKIVARKDRGILKPQDLSGKRLGYSSGTSDGFFIDSYLLFHGITDAVKVTLAAQTQKNVSMLLEGQIDALTLFPPFDSQAQAALGANATVLGDPALYQVNFVLVSTRAWAEANPQAVQRLLRAWIAATRQIGEQPEASFSSMAAELRLTSAQLKPIWDPGNLDVRLHPELLATMENQEHWALRQGLVPGATGVKIFDLLWFPGLDAVAPARVTIRH